MVEFYVLRSHAAAAMGIDPSRLNLPTCGLGISAEALWTDPRFIEVRRSRAAIAAQYAARRYEVHLKISSRAAAIIKMELRPGGQRRIGRCRVYTHGAR